MAFKARITSIIPIPDDKDSGVVYQTIVVFTDDTSGFTSEKTYLFPVTVIQADAVAVITADGMAMKTMIATAGNLKSKVGTTITI